MNKAENSTDKLPREFAVEVVTKLRSDGFEALWAGGCVRDQLIGIEPKDYDVATNATPEQVILLFGKHKTVPVGVSFGVVMVLGPTRAHGQVEVATFRTDGEYLDGRRPSAVSFCSSEEDAKRRDFTINGMFFDPVSEEVIDFVGGKQDLQAGVVRAIGDPVARFTEDKLRMLRAVRFASTYKFELDPATATAIKTLGSELVQVSAERIAQELRRMFAHRTRAVSLKQLYATGLIGVLFPALLKASSVATASDEYIEQVCQHISRLQIESFETTFAAIMSALFHKESPDVLGSSQSLIDECRALRLSNEETTSICWLAAHVVICSDSRHLPLHVIKPMLHDPRRDLLLDLLESNVNESTVASENAAFLRSYREQASAGDLNPEPFIDGRDLKNLGITPGPVFKELLTTIRNEQLDEQILTREQAFQRLRELHPTESS